MDSEKLQLHRLIKLNIHRAQSIYCLSSYFLSDVIPQQKMSQFASNSRLYLLFLATACNLEDFLFSFFLPHAHPTPPAPPPSGG